MLKVTTWVQHSIDSHPFCSMSIGHPIIQIQHFQNFTLKIQVQCHGWGADWKSQHESNVLSTNIPFVPCYSAIPSLRYDLNSKFDLEKCKVKVMGEVNDDSHNKGPIFYRLTSFSFHVNRPCHSWDRTFSKFDLESWQSQSGCYILLIHIPFSPCQSALPFLRYSIFKNWPWKSQVKVKWPWCCTTIGLDNSIELEMV